MTEPLAAETIRVAGALWKQAGRTITASFGGTSMQPTIVAGEPVVLRCGAPFGVGDIVMFFHLDRMVVHRVLALNKDLVLTIGDHHVLPDPFVTPQASIIACAEPRPLPALRAMARAARALCASLFRLSPAAVPLLVRSVRTVSRLARGRSAQP